MKPEKLNELINTDYADRMDEAVESDLSRPGTDEVLVSRTLRLSLEMFEAIKVEAARQDVKPSSLMRQWIEEGLQRSRNASPSVDVEQLVQAIRHLAQQAHRSDAA